MNQELDSQTQYALLSTFKASIDNGAHFSSLIRTLEHFITAFELSAEQAASLRQVRTNFEEGKELCELFEGCGALDKRIRFFLTLPYAVNAGQWSDSFDLALKYLERVGCRTN